jgi:hypothetical protein
VSVRKVDDAWERLNEAYGLAETLKLQPVTTITASQIHDLGYEPRLMAKFDSLEDLPKIFSKNNWGIMPSSRGDYQIGYFDNFQSLPPPSSRIEIHKYPANLESLTAFSVYSEAAALNLAYSSGVLSHLLGETVVPTVSGRMASGTFEYSISRSLPDYKFHVSRAQIEIDGGYEGNSFLALVEAKKKYSASFNTRQLYFPYRTWQQRISKQVRNIFMVHSGDIFSFSEWQFTNIADLSSISLISKRSFVLGEFSWQRAEVLEVAKRKRTDLTQLDCPYPQADDVSKYFVLIKALGHSDLNKHEIQSLFDFDLRQSDYYANALQALGYVYKTNSRKWALTDEGTACTNMTNTELNRDMATRMMRIPAFRKSIISSQGDFEGMTRESISRLVSADSAFGNKPFSENTKSRRVSTIQAWIRWLGDTCS